MKKLRWCLTGLLFLFLTLKLTGHIDWSWWQVLAPFWIPLVIATTGYAASGIAWLLMSKEQRARNKLCKSLEALQKHYR